MSLIEEMYEEGLHDTFNVFHEHCTYGHIVYVDKKSWWSCFAIERRDWTDEKYKCSFENCPLIKGVCDVQR